MPQRCLWPLLALPMLLAACSGGEFSNSVKNNFLQSCSAPGRSSPLFCQCALEQLQREYSEDEYAAQEVEMRTTQRLPERLQQSFTRIRQQCPQS